MSRHLIPRPVAACPDVLTRERRAVTRSIALERFFLPDGLYSLIILTLSTFTLLVLAKSRATDVFEQSVCMVRTVQPVGMLKVSSRGASWLAVIANAFGTRNTSGNPEPAMIDNHALDRISHQHSFLATQRHSLLTICLSPKISAPHSGQNLGTNAPMSPKPMYSQS